MNTSNLAQNAYGSTSRVVQTPRSAEYAAFSHITSALKAAKDFAEKVEALTLNRRLWTVLAADLAGDGNGLPEQLRAQLLSLANFTNQHTSKVLRGEADESPLIEINTSIMAGLRQRQQDAPA